MNSGTKELQAKPPSGDGIRERTPLDACRSVESHAARTLCAYFGVRGGLVYAHRENHTDCLLALKIHLPLASFISSHLLVADLAFRTFPLCWSLEPLQGSRLCIAKVVRKDTPIMTACDCGNEFAVREMFRKHEARPTDVTEGNWTPLAVSTIIVF